MTTLDPHDSAPPVAPRVVLRPLGSPLALGTSALAVAAFTSAGLDLRWIPVHERLETGLLILLFTPLLQLGAAVFALLARDTVAATGLGLLGATWLVRGASIVATANGRRSVALGTLLFAAAALILLVAWEAAASADKRVPAAVFGVSGAHFVLTALHEVGAGDAFRVLTGIVGLLLAVLAVAAAATLGRKDRAHDTVAREPGVRAQL